MNYAELLPVDVQAIEIAHDLFLTCSPGELTAKGDRDMASEVDYAIERQLSACP